MRTAVNWLRYGMYMVYSTVIYMSNLRPIDSLQPRSARLSKQTRPTTNLYVPSVATVDYSIDFNTEFNKLLRLTLPDPGDCEAILQSQRAS